MALGIAFWILAIICIASALTVVLLQNIFRAALALVLCFVAVAGLYITLSADFLAAIQILVYVGAISILLILGIMLTHEVQHGSPSNKLQFPALVVALVFMSVMIVTFLSTSWTISADAPIEPTTQALAVKLFGENGFILTMEMAGVLLLAAVMGAIIMVREK